MEQLSKLSEHKDNNVFKDLAALAGPRVERGAAANLSKSICQARLGPASSWLDAGHVVGCLCDGNMASWRLQACVLASSFDQNLEESSGCWTGLRLDPAMLHCMHHICMKCL